MTSSYHTLPAKTNLFPRQRVLRRSEMVTDALSPFRFSLPILVDLTTAGWCVRLAIAIGPRLRVNFGEGPGRWCTQLRELLPPGCDEIISTKAQREAAWKYPMTRSSAFTDSDSNNDNCNSNHNCNSNYSFEGVSKQWPTIQK